MLDIQLIRDNPQKVKDAAKNKGLKPNVVDEVLRFDQKRRELIQKVEEIRKKRNELNERLKQKRSEKLIAQSKELKGKLQDLEPQLKETEEAYAGLMLQVPNVPAADVPVDSDSSGNVKLGEWGKKPKFSFPPKDHIELGTSLNILDLDRGSKVGGFRGYFLKNEGAFLHLGIMRFALDRLVKKGFTPVVPPIINKPEAFINSGHFPWGQREAYPLHSDESVESNQSLTDRYLAGTAEVPLVSYHAGETFAEKDLPILYAGFSPCYRREIGSYGKDTRGIYRVHEFLKIEQVVLCKNDWQESAKWHEKLRAYAEELLQELELHYRVLLMCTGDMGEPQIKKYDLETWMPGRGEYGETMSDSIMGDFQARRANIRYQANDGSIKFVHTLNNTALASPRILIALWENYQQKDGSITIPKALVPYVGFESIKPK